MIFFTYSIMNQARTPKTFIYLHRILACITLWKDLAFDQWARKNYLFSQRNSIERLSLVGYSFGGGPEIIIFSIINIKKHIIKFDKV